MIKHVNLNDFEEEVLKSKKVVLADFFATWCGPCQMLAPILEELANEQSDFDIAKIDIDMGENQELAINYGIDAVPTMIIFKNGEIVHMMQGLSGKQEILDTVKKYI